MSEQTSCGGAVQGRQAFVPCPILNAPDPAARTERVRALLEALGAAEFSDDIGEAAVTVEALIVGSKRIDLLVEWKDSSGLLFGAQS